MLVGRFLGFGRATQARSKKAWKVEDYHFDLGELVCFYSGMSEQAEVDFIDRTFNPKKSTDFFKCIRDDDGKLVGLVRAWTDDKRGIIYDIAVTPEHREEGAGKALRDYVVETYKPSPSDTNPHEIKWNGNPFRITAYLDRALGVLRILYAISFVLGFQKLGEAVYFLAFQDHTHLLLSGAVKGLNCWMVSAKRQSIARTTKPEYFAFKQLLANRRNRPSNLSLSTSAAFGQSLGLCESKACHSRDVYRGEIDRALMQLEL